MGLGKPDPAQLSNLGVAAGTSAYICKKSKRAKKKKHSSTVHAEHGDVSAPDGENQPTVSSPDASTVEKSLLSNGVNEKLLKQLTNLMLTSSSDIAGRPVGAIKEKKCKEDYRFWRTQPVPDLNEEISDNCAIEPDKPNEEIRSEPYSLPPGFSWCELSLNDDAQLQELYDLLYENYVEDEDHLFRFDYSKPFLKWALQAPGWHPDWHVGLRVDKSNKLIGFIGAIPCELRIYEKTKKMVEINFLCVHKKLRSKRMAPVLIREVTRRVHLRGLFQALYTSGALLPRPVVTCRYWHRPLNPRKLIDCGFSHLSHNMTLQRSIKLYRLPEATMVKGFRQMTKADVPQAWALLTKYLEQYSLHPIFSKEDFQHFFVPRDDIVNSFVVENENKVITDFCSYYVLPSSVMKCKQYSTLRAAYSFYNAATETPWPALVQDMLITAKQVAMILQ
ncbi:glycylpeptide N-tetradecanoyltransferase [Paragonimus westermani]|uniref:Glycylpeptide N-tetradecanoyltransferase n=1 Tax=Paragonimus westermani TaxID=34504 RepID=A0A5J4P160_9TREM|nr:glycylpeptide N-tetradecanoyltransferase [Paragonimus westermani]